MDYVDSLWPTCNVGIVSNIEIYGANLERTKAAAFAISGKACHLAYSQLPSGRRRIKYDSCSHFSKNPAISLSRLYISSSCLRECRSVMRWCYTEYLASPLL